MRQKHVACLAYYGLPYYGIPSPSAETVNSLASFLKADIPEVVHLTDEALSEGAVIPSLSKYSFIALLFARDEYEERIQDSVNYIQRTLGKTIQAQAWLDLRKGTQRLLNVRSQPAWVVDPPVPTSDGIHYTVELRDEERQWEPMESGWESSNQFESAEEAEVAAQNLARRHDGRMDFRVVSPNGVVLAAFRVKKHLEIRRRGRQIGRVAFDTSEEIPMLHEALEHYHLTREGRSV